MASSAARSRTSCKDDCRSFKELEMVAGSTEFLCDRITSSSCSTAPTADRIPFLTSCLENRTADASFLRDVTCYWINCFSNLKRRCRMVRLVSSKTLSYASTRVLKKRTLESTSKVQKKATGTAGSANKESGCAKGWTKQKTQYPTAKRFHVMEQTRCAIKLRRYNSKQSSSSGEKPSLPTEA